MSAQPRATRWSQIDWSAPLPEDLLVPEHQYSLPSLGFLTRRDRVRLNRLAVCYSCELFIHFERYLVAYLERHRRRVSDMPEPLRRRFVAEEERHIEAFFNVVEKVRPDLYSARRLRLLRWSWLDELLLWLTPRTTFFLLAALFEEITLFVPAVMEERPGESFGPIYEVMRLHAQEERGHVAIDERMFSGAAKPGRRFYAAVELMLVLPLLWYMDTQARRAWERTVERFAGEAGLDREGRRALLRKRASRSDVLGAKSFAEKLRASSLPGAGLLGALLEKAVA